ncbi:MAG: hypothetical protein K2F81_04605 [Ruminococcus sp.]|nr:hypothetical protein [Ruminococcus sp.]
MDAITFNNLTITSHDKLSCFSRMTGKCKFELTEMQNVKVSNTEETKDIVGKGGKILKTLKQNKATTVSGTSGLISGGLMAAQTGSDETTGKVKIIQKEIISYATSGPESGAPYRFINGTPVDGKILDIREVSNNGSLILNNWVEGDTAGENTYSCSHSANQLYQITFPTNLKHSDVRNYAIYYYTEVDGSKISNQSDVHGDTLYGELDVTCSDTCDNEYHGKFIFPRLDFSGQFDIDMNGEQVVHAFEAKALADTCGNKDNTLWDFILYKDSNESNNEAAEPASHAMSYPDAEFEEDAPVEENVTVG